MLELEQPVEQLESWDPGAGARVEPGVYEAVVDEVEVKQSQSGYPKLSIRYRIAEGPSTGGAVYGDRSLHLNALPFFRGMLDVLNVFATGRSIDERKLVGRYLRIQVIEYDKNDGSKGVKVDKLFKSDLNAHKNDQLDISAKNGVAPGRAAAPSKNVKPAPQKDDDLPF